MVGERAGLIVPGSPLIHGHPPRLVTIPGPFRHEPCRVASRVTEPLVLRISFWEETSSCRLTEAVVSGAGRTLVMTISRACRLGRPVELWRVARVIVREGINEHPALDGRRRADSTPVANAPKEKISQFVPGFFSSA